MQSFAVLTQRQLGWSSEAIFDCPDGRYRAGLRSIVEMAFCAETTEM